MPNGGQHRVPPTPANGSQHEQVHSAKKQTKWTPQEDEILIMLRATGMKWEDISTELPGRSAISCRLHYQNYLEKRTAWNEDKKNKLARLYERFKFEMWNKIAIEMGVPCRAVEAMHWKLGRDEMADRAGVPRFELVDPGEGSNRSPQRSHQTPAAPVHYSREVAPMHGGGHHHHHGHTRSHSLSTVPVGQGGPGRELYPPQSHQPLASAPRQPQTHYQSYPPPAHGSHGGPAPAAVAAAAAAMAGRSAPRSPYPLPPRGEQIKQEPRGDYIKTEYTEEPLQQASSGPGLAPIQSAPRPGGRDLLPSIRELTTGISPSRDSGPAGPAPRGPSPHGHPVPSAGQGYGAGYPNQAYGSTGHKRRASVDAESREVQRRRLG